MKTFKTSTNALQFCEKIEFFDNYNTYVTFRPMDHRLSQFYEKRTTYPRKFLIRSTHLFVYYY